MAAAAITFVLSQGHSANCQLAVSAAAAGIDNIPPAPPSHVRASDRPGDEGGHILVSWILSADDKLVTWGQAGRYLIDTLPRGAVRRRGIDGYRIYRVASDTTLIGVVAAGTGHFVDSTATDGTEYMYDVRAFDAAGEGAPTVTPGTIEDRARRARSRNNQLKPVDSRGQPLMGWFDPHDNRIGLDDFFLFADHFGRRDGEIDFDSLYDLDGDYAIDFDDLFLFLDHFGGTVANFE